MVYYTYIGLDFEAHILAFGSGVMTWCAAVSRKSESPGWKKLLTYSFLHSDPWDMEMVLFGEWNFFSVIFSLLMTSSLRHLAVFLQIFSFFHLKTRCEVAQHAPFGHKFGKKVDLINFFENWYRKRHISHYYDVILGNFWPNFGPKGLKMAFKDHVTLATRLTTWKNRWQIWKRHEIPLPVMYYTYIGLDRKAKIRGSGT